MFIWLGFKAGYHKKTQRDSIEWTDEMVAYARVTLIDRWIDV